MDEIRTPGYWAVIPAGVRYDNELRPNAKLLYGEISALAMAEGYCWANNDYFAQLFGLSRKTVGELIGQLAKRGHVRLEVIRDDETNEVLQRRIWIANLPEVSAPPPPKNRVRSPEKTGDPPPKNREENNTSINNIPPYNPPKGGARRELTQEAKANETVTEQVRKQMAPEAMRLLTEYVRGRGPDLVHALVQYLETRAANRKAVKTLATAELIIRKLDQLSGGDDAVKVAILEQSVERSWTGLFALDKPRDWGGGDRPAAEREWGIDAI